MTLYQGNASDPYGFGLRVVGAGPPAVPDQHIARVLWIAPGGPAHRAGITVGDRVSDRVRQKRNSCCIPIMTCHIVVLFVRTTP